MMRCLALRLLAMGAVLAVVLVPAARGDNASDRPLLKPIYYSRTGGMKRDVIRVSANGVLSAFGMTQKTVNRQLSDQQVRYLDEMMREWEKLQASYPAPAGKQEDVVYVIRYGTKAVRASEQNKDVPSVFRKVRKKLEEWAKE